MVGLDVKRKVAPYLLDLVSTFVFVYVSTDHPPSMICALGLFCTPVSSHESELALLQYIRLCRQLKSQNFNGATSSPWFLMLLLALSSRFMVKSSKKNYIDSVGSIDIVRGGKKDLQHITQLPYGELECESAALMDSRENLIYKRRSVNVKPVATDSDRKFLIDFMITTYLGPDVKSHNPRSSVTQRLMVGSPPYILSDLGPSYVTIAFLERLYYNLLRYSSPELVLDLSMFHMYLKGKLFLPSSDFTPDSKQFTSFFPLDLHEQKWYPDSFRIVRGIVVIDDPPMTCIKEEDLNRFKSLTRVITLKLNLSEYLKNKDDDNCVNKGPESSGKCQSGKFQQGHKRKDIDDTMPEFCPMFPTKQNVKVDASKNTCKSDGPSFMPLLSVPDAGVGNHDCSLVLTGTARKGILGPSIGMMDLGIGARAYIFRVSLAGVQKDLSKFNCDVETNGRVLISGVVNGGRTIKKQSRVFQMKLRKLCPPGPFTLSFNLPGPIDPRLFTANFRADGLLEGIAIMQ
ncbi:hypothetical protein VNO80_28370 [Phaseolus coccineus]|uniref:Increased DNA methylation 3 n=1 Tax=Phaseolus coccineus TaxID=3886 RepID=A0AAN9LCC7_PHACN